MPLLMMRTRAAGTTRSRCTTRFRWLNLLECHLLLLKLLVLAHAVLGGRDGAFINYTEKECKDETSWCPVWAAEGECTRNPSLPKQTCPLSCGTCTISELAPLTDKNAKVILHTDFGEIPIQLLVTQAPATCTLVHHLASQKGCADCHFYRNELPPKEGTGPPYGLLQGTMRGLLKLPESEGHIPMKRGHVAFIPNMVEFFISAMDHSEWGDAHIVWGEVTDMSAVDKILKEPYHEYKHPDYGTIMRMMNKNLPFTISHMSSAT